MTSITLHSLGRAQSPILPMDVTLQVVTAQGAVVHQVDLNLAWDAGDRAATAAWPPAAYLVLPRNRFLRLSTSVTGSLVPRALCASVEGCPAALAALERGSRRTPWVAASVFT